MKLLYQPIWHFGHYFMLLQLQMVAAILLNPVVILIATVLLMIPAQPAISCLLSLTTALQKCVNMKADKRVNPQKFKETLLDRLYSNGSEAKLMWAGMNVCAHTWCWFYIAMLILCPDGWTKASFAKGLVYMLLSELFLHGFAFHPYFGYFLGVHRSFGQGFVPASEPAGMPPKYKPGDENISDCQPTMSTYDMPFFFHDRRLCSRKGRMFSGVFRTPEFDRLIETSLPVSPHTIQHHLSAGSMR
jgi:hypothetical protein